MRFGKVVSCGCVGIRFFDGLQAHRTRDALTDLNVRHRRSHYLPLLGVSLESFTT